MNPLLEMWASLRRREPRRQLVLGMGHHCSVEEIDDLALAVTHEVQGMPAQTPVLLRGDGGPAFLAAVLGLWRAQLVPVLAEGNTPLTAAQRCAEVLGCSAIATLLEEWPQRNEWFSLRVLVPGSSRTCPNAMQGAVLKLTSGSSGAPRAVLATAEQLLADDAQLTSSMGLNREDRILASIPLSHSYGFASVALPAMIRGTRIVTPERSVPFAPFAAARHHDVTFLPSTPAYLRALVTAKNPPQPPAALRKVIAAGAPLAAETAARFREIYGQPVHTFYGSSETGGITFDREGGAAERGTVGSPVDGVMISIVSEGAEESDRSDQARAGSSSPSQEAGHVVVHSPAVAATYFPHPEPTLADGRFRTADLGVWSDGELQLVGRSDRQLNIRGKKLAPEELEQLLLEVDGVEECVAVMVHPAAASQPAADSFLRVVVASRVAKESELRTFCARHLPPHKRPRSYVVLDELPRNQRGKIDYSRLANPSFGGRP